LYLSLNIKEPTEEIIKKLIEIHKEKIKRYQKLQKYYEGDHEILQRMLSDDAKPNNKLVHDFPGYIIDTLQGYFMGKPVRYSSLKDEMIRKIQDVFDYNDDLVDPLPPFSMYSVFLFFLIST